jgi:hypothetical protein
MYSFNVVAVEEKRLGVSPSIVIAECKEAEFIVREIKVKEMIIY